MTTHKDGKKTASVRLLACCGAAALALLASGCVSPPAGTAQPPTQATLSPLPNGGSGSRQPPGPSPTPIPTQVINPDLQHIFFTYQHPTNVFSLTMPETWSARDESSDERLLVVLEPPLGFASRVTADIVYESDLTLNQLAALRDSYLELYYGSDPNYTEINRTELPDGRLQVTLLYNNPAGASGRETVYLSQSGPYFSALRVFVSDHEVMTLSDVIEQIVESYAVNPTARWGEPVVEVESGALQVQALNGWLDGEGSYRVTGLVFNAWQAEVGFLSVKASVCDPDGLVLDENTVLLANDLLPPGGFAPFEVRFGPIGHPEPRPCLVEADAEPASSLELDTYSKLEIPDTSLTASYDPQAEIPILTVGGTVFNRGTETAHLIDVIIAVYDGPVDSPDTGVIGYAVATTEAAELAPGQASFFAYSFGPGELGGTPVSWEPWVQASALQSTPPP